jgi:hypothetical protein
MEEAYAVEVLEKKEVLGRLRTGQARAADRETLLA